MPFGFPHPPKVYVARVDGGGAHEALWDVSSDGQRFAFVWGAGAANEIRVELLLHWAQSIGGGAR